MSFRCYRHGTSAKISRKSENPCPERRRSVIDSASDDSLAFRCDLMVRCVFEYRCNKVCDLSSNPNAGKQSFTMRTISLKSLVQHTTRNRRRFTRNVIKAQRSAVTIP